MAWLVAAVAAIVVLAALVWLRHQLVRERRAFARLCEAIGAVAAGLAATGEHDGVAYRLSYGADDAPDALCITLGCRSRARWSARRIRDAGTSGRSSVETGDADFDRAVQLGGDSPEAAAAYFADGGRRRAARKLLELGFTTVRLDGRVLEAIWPGIDLDNPPDTRAIGGALGYLVTLGQGVPGFPFFSRSFGGFGRRTQRLVARAVPVLLFWAGGAGSAAGLLGYHPIDPAALFATSLICSLPLWLVYTAFAWRVLRGTARAERELTATLLWSFGGLVLGGFGALAFVNGVADTGFPAVQSVRVVRKLSLLPLHLPARVVAVESWRGAGATTLLRVAPAVYERIEPGITRLLVVTKPGRFGFEWVVRVEPVGTGP
jgi:hypothetical protein